MAGTMDSQTKPPPLYDTLYPIVVEYLHERGYLSAGTVDMSDVPLLIPDHLLDGEDGLRYRIWNAAYDKGRKDEESDTYEWNRLD